jgi:hypothetical protein
MLGDEMDHGPHQPVGLITPRWSPPELYRRVCQLCPSGINVFISILRRNGRSKRTLWQMITIQGDDDEKQELDECHDHPGPSIIVPHKPFRGQVGICQYIWSWDLAITQQKIALRVLRFAAIERYHFHGRHEAFGCPALNCDAWFERPEEYTTHVLRTASHRDNSYVLLGPYQALFADGEKRLEQLEQRLREVTEPFFKWWEKHGSEERKVAEKEFLRELEHDPLHVRGDPLFQQRWLTIMESYDRDY